MINRIRVVTLLVMVLGVFALLQLISGSLFFSSLCGFQSITGTAGRADVNMGFNAANAH
jgi:hypothetical protein